MQTNVFETFLSYSERHRFRVTLVAVCLALLIVLVDWKYAPGASLGFLYIVPILLVSSQFTGWQVFAAAVMCSVLREQFGNVSWQEGAPLRMAIAMAGFALGGFFVSDLNRQRLQVMQHLREREAEARLRESAERKLRVLIDTSPLAILTLDCRCRVLNGNDSAAEILGFERDALVGADIGPLIPILGLALNSGQPSGLRTTIESNARRVNGEVFLAHIWLSTYATPSGPELAAVIWDESENLRDRERTTFDSMMATSRVLIGAFSHEIRNLANAALSAEKELRLLPGVAGAEPAQALNAVLAALAELASSGLAVASRQSQASVELGTVLDEARVLIDGPIQESGGAVSWTIPARMPLVHGDRHALLQVLLNLARNAEQAMRGSAVKELRVDVSLEDDFVLIRFRDTGHGVANPAILFEPFRSGTHSTGLGLYISRATVRAHGGDLKYEPQGEGSCFTVELWPVQSDSGAAVERG